MIDLNASDRRQLVKFLIEMPEMANERSRSALLLDAGLGSLIAKIDLSGPPFLAAGEIVNHLALYGQHSKEKIEVLGMFLTIVKDYVGADRQASIDELLKKYNMMLVSEEPSPESTAEKETGDRASDRLEKRDSDAPKPPIDPLAPMGTRWAFLVGINHYTIPLQFPDLEYCVNDVLALQDLLESIGYKVVCLHDNSDRESRIPTRENIEAELEVICKSVEENDVLFVHFACHGKLHQDRPMLIARDTRILGRALSVSAVETRMRKSKARRLILSLDSCQLGVKMGRKSLDFEFIRNVYELAEGFVFLAASTAQQAALEWAEKEHGVYTYYLLEALRGKGDRADKNFVTVDDVKNHVLNALRHWNVQQGVLQESTVRTEGMGDMILADYRKYPRSDVPPADEATKNAEGNGDKVEGRSPRSESESESEDIVAAAPNTREIRRQELSKDRDATTRQYELVKLQARGTFNGVKRSRLERQAAELFEEMERLERELKALEDWV